MQNRTIPPGKPSDKWIKNYQKEHGLKPCTEKDLDPITAEVLRQNPTAFILGKRKWV